MYIYIYIDMRRQRPAAAPFPMVWSAIDASRGPFRVIHSSISALEGHLV